MSSELPEKITTFVPTFSVVSGSFRFENTIQCSTVGTIASPDAARIATQKNVHTTSTNFAYTVNIFYQPNLQFEIKARMSDDYSDYVSLGVDIGGHQVYITGKSGSTILPAQTVTHHFQDDLYKIELWCIEDRLAAVVNGSILVDITWAYNVTNNNFGLKVITLPDSPPAVFSSYYVEELSYAPAHGTEDPSDLFLVFRKQIKDYIENPPGKTWNTFREARLVWSYGLDVGRTNDTWTELGYPIQEPTSEEWFGN